MKSIKLVSCVAAGLIALGTVSAQAAASLSINITTWQQGSSTADDVTTYTSTAVSIKNADLLAKVAAATGISLPAGATLAISTTEDAPDDVYVGDVVILNALGQVIYDLTEEDGFGTDIGFADIYLGFDDQVEQYKQVASKSESITAKGEAYLGFYIGTYDTEETLGTGMNGEFYDNMDTVQGTKGLYGSQMTSGTYSFSGGGEINFWTGEFFEDEGATDTFQPASEVVSGAQGAVPWSVSFIGNNFEE